MNQPFSKVSCKQIINHKANQMHSCELSSSYSIFARGQWGHYTLQKILKCWKPSNCEGKILKPTPERRFYSKSLTLTWKKSPCSSKRPNPTQMNPEPPSLLSWGLKKLLIHLRWLPEHSKDQTPRPSLRYFNVKIKISMTFLLPLQHSNRAQIIVLRALWKTWRERNPPRIKPTYNQVSIIRFTTGDLHSSSGGTLRRSEVERILSSSSLRNLKLIYDGVEGVLRLLQVSHSRISTWNEDARNQALERCRTTSLQRKEFYGI